MTEDEMEDETAMQRPPLLRRFLPAAGGLLALLLLSRVPFVVEATELAVRTRFGRPVAVVTKPGLHARVPLVDDVVRLDARLLYFDPPAGEFLTNDKKNIVVAPFVLWRVDDPLRFLQTLVTRESAEARLADLVASETGAALGAVPFTRLVSATAGEADLAGVVAGIAERVRKRAGADYGVRVVDVRLKRIAFPEQNLLSVFGRMRSERERIARRFRSEGEEAALKIRAEADRERTRLLAEAYRKAEEEKGAGEAEAARIYARATSQDPELYRFLRTLRAYEKILDDKTTLVLPGDSEVLRLLTEGASAAPAPRKGPN
jgi:membrane protease subunit HflC